MTDNAHNAEYACQWEPTPGTLNGQFCTVHGTDNPEHDAENRAAIIDAAHLSNQREWSERTFGPGRRTNGVIDHIRKELVEIEADPTDLSEWVDVVILALDGAWRAGWEPQEIIDTIKAKQAKNEARTWPDWRTMSADQAIEHDRTVLDIDGSA